MTKIKLCGMMSVQDAGYCNLVKPDLAGIIFAPGRMRTVTPNQAHCIRRALDRRIPAVGVFINAQIGEITALGDRGIIQLAQLHGSEDNAYIAELRKRSNLLIIQAIRVRSDADMQRAEKSDADILLLDGGAGEGRTFDWSHLRDFRRPYFLAGGLDAECVGQAIRDYAPYGVDVSSGIESDGRKDPIKMQAFVSAVRALDNRNNQPNGGI